MWYLTPGPTQIHDQLAHFLNDAVRDDVLCKSHRSQFFADLVARCIKALRLLLMIPSDYHVLFLSSATEVWERSIENGAERHTLHFVNGAFSERYAQIARELGRSPEIVARPRGGGFSASDLPQRSSPELVTLTLNETSTGVALRKAFIEAVRDQYPEAVLAVDAVSAAPVIDGALSITDYYFFSVQKCFSLPAGLGVLIVSPRALRRAKDLRQRGISIGSYHAIPSLVTAIDKFQTPSTPNVLGIYLLARTVELMLERGLSSLTALVQRRAGLLYESLAASSRLAPLVNEKSDRSPTVVTVHVPGDPSALIAHLRDRKVQIGEGYGAARATEARIANFPLIDDEPYEIVCEALRAY